MTRRRLLVWLAAGAMARPAEAQQERPAQELKMMQAEGLIEQYRRGGEFRPQTPGLTAGGRVIPQEVEALAAALPKENGHVREQIVRLLGDLGRRSDPLFSQGAAILREPRVVSALANQALAVDDGARDTALSLLHEFVPASALAPYADSLTADFERQPSSSSFLVLAKAKPPQARAVVRRIAATPRWQDEESALIALAAFGDAAKERRFTGPLASTRDAREFERLAKLTGWIGTPTALKALADQVRTSLIFEIPNAVRRSARLSVIAALSFNYPEVPTLFVNNIVSEASYEAVEAFCRQQFGTQWPMPRPPFLVDQPFPF
jgi:hypothetical protein